jgi:hypothetical protein
MMPINYSSGGGQPAQQQQQPQQQQGGGGGDNGGGRPAFDEGAFNAQLDAAYNPAMSALDALEAQYKQEFPTSQQSVEQSYAPVVSEMQNAQNTQIAGIGSQRTKGKAQESSEIAKARRRYNELMQNSNAMYGGTSSIAQGSQELLGRTTQEQMGGIDQSYGSYYRDLDTEEKNANDFFANKKVDLEKEKQLKLQELKNAFDQSLRQINTQRTGLQSEKAAKRLEALQQYSMAAQQAKYDAQVFNSKLEQWKTMKDQMLTQAKQYQAKSITVPGFDNVLSSFSMGGMNNGTNAGSNYATAKGDLTGAGYVWDPASGKWVKDLLATSGGVNGNWWE